MEELLVVSSVGQCAGGVAAGSKSRVSSKQSCTLFTVDPLKRICKRAELAADKLPKQSQSDSYKEREANDRLSRLGRQLERALKSSSFEILVEAAK